ncbi:MAG: amidohydrolase family protein, partial [Deltaproteobacteria bacterium]|nr:amidohydrolase family protein [Deltaproteobacteria bacterium]
MRRLLTNVRIIDGLGGVLEGGWILVDQGRIEAVGPGPSGSPQGRNDEETLDFSGKTLLPGLIDCHVHLVLDGGPDPMAKVVGAPDAEAVLKMAANGLKTLKAGFTTVR